MQLGLIFKNLFRGELSPLRGLLRPSNGYFVILSGEVLSSVSSSMFKGHPSQDALFFKLPLSLCCNIPLLQINIKFHSLLYHHL